MAALTFYSIIQSIQNFATENTGLWIFVTKETVTSILLIK